MLLKKYFSWITVVVLTAAIAVSATSCDNMDDKEIPYVSLSIMEIQLNYDGYWYAEDKDEADGAPSTLKANFEVSANEAWSLTTTASWLKFSQTSGDRGKIRVFIESEQNDSGAIRTADIVVSAGPESSKITVVQLDKYPYFLVSPGTIDVGKDGNIASGAKAMVTVSSTDVWKVSIPDALKEWISVNKTSGGSDSFEETTDVVTLTVEPTTANTPRTGQIVFESERNVKRTITIVQNISQLYYQLSGNPLVNMKGEVSKGEPFTFEVNAKMNWSLGFSENWVTADKTSGTDGTETATLQFTRNTTGKKRTAKVTLSSDTGLTATFDVTQTGNGTIYDDDGLDQGFEYYNEPFDWSGKFGMDDQVANKDNTTGLGIYSNSDALSEFVVAGFNDYNISVQSIYLMSHYLRIGDTGKQSGVILPLLSSIGSEKVTNVTLSFKVAPYIAIDGTVDNTEFTVEVVEGEGTVNGYTSVTSDSMPHSITSEGEWMKIELVLYGVTAETRIAIRSTQQGESGQYRFFLDEIKCVKHSAVQ